MCLSQLTALGPQTPVDQTLLFVSVCERECVCACVCPSCRESKISPSSLTHFFTIQSVTANRTLTPESLCVCVFVDLCVCVCECVSQPDE